VQVGHKIAAIENVFHRAKRNFGSVRQLQFAATHCAVKRRFRCIGISGFWRKAEQAENNRFIRTVTNTRQRESAL